MSITLAELRTNSRNRADMSDNEFISDTELNTYINSSIAELYDLIIQAYNGDYYLVSTTSTLTSGTQETDLPSDFYKLRGVDAKLNGTDWFTLRQFNFNERNRYKQSSAAYIYTDTLIRYRLVKNKLRFEPIPDGATDIRIWYTPLAPILSDDADTFDDINQYAEYVIVDAAIKMKEKEESDVGVLYAQKQALIKRIEEAAQNRDTGSPESISDIYVENADYWLYGSGNS